MILVFFSNQIGDGVDIVLGLILMAGLIYFGPKLFELPINHDDFERDTATSEHPDQEPHDAISKRKKLSEGSEIVLFKMKDALEKLQTNDVQFHLDNITANDGQEARSEALRWMFYSVLPNHAYLVRQLEILTALGLRADLESHSYIYVEMFYTCTPAAYMVMGRCTDLKYNPFLNTQITLDLGECLQTLSIIPGFNIDAKESTTGLTGLGRIVTTLVLIRDKGAYTHVAGKSFETMMMQMIEAGADLNRAVGGVEKLLGKTLAANDVCDSTILSKHIACKTAEILLANTATGGTSQGKGRARL